SSTSSTAPASAVSRSLPATADQPSACSSPVRGCLDARADPPRDVTVYLLRAARFSLVCACGVSLVDRAAAVLVPAVAHVSERCAMRALRPGPPPQPPVTGAATCDPHQGNWSAALVRP